MRRRLSAKEYATADKKAKAAYKSGLVGSAANSPPILKTASDAPIKKRKQSADRSSTKKTENDTTSPAKKPKGNASTTTEKSKTKAAPTSKNTRSDATASTKKSKGGPALASEKDKASTDMGNQTLAQLPTVPVSKKPTKYELAVKPAPSALTARGKQTAKRSGGHIVSCPYIRHQVR